MNAVGKLGSYLSRGVVTVSAPFNPFSGAVDIVVVEQQDGSFKSSPWYIQFGKFQGALQAREKVVSINVNGVEADFRMYLDSKGGAYFLREVDGSESTSSSGLTNGSSTSSSKFEARNKKIMTRTGSTGPRVLGFAFGRRSWKENAVGRDREASLERAEIAADLLELRWSTSLATRKHNKGSASGSFDGVHGKGEAENLLSTSPVNYMESFTLKESYLDVNVIESSVGSNGGDMGTNLNSVKSDAGGVSSGDEQSSTSQALRVIDERRMERLESSIYCDTSESFTDDLDGSSGESSENLCFTSSVSSKMDAPTKAYDDERELISKMNSESPSSILACRMFSNTENLEDKEPCRSIDGSKSNSSVGSDVETVLETKLAVLLQCKTNEGPVKYVEEMEVDQIVSSQEPSLTNSFLVEEVTSSMLESLENFRFQKNSCPASTDLFQMGSGVNNENQVGSINESNRDDFEMHTTNAGLPSDLGSSELQRIESMAYLSADSDTEENNSLNFGGSSEGKVGLLTEKPNVTQFFFSDLDGSELTKTKDTQSTSLDSLVTENDSQYYSKSNEEKLGESTGITHEQVDQTTQRVKSLPNIWSHEAGKNAHGANHSISRSLDSNIDNMRLVQGNFPTALETGEQKWHSTPKSSSMEHTQMSEELKKILSHPAVEVSLCRHLLYEDMGQEAAAQAFDAEKLDTEKLLLVGSDIVRHDRVVVRVGGLYFPWDAALPIISAIASSSTGEQILETKGMITVDEVENGVIRRPSVATIATASQRDTSGNTDSPKSESMKKRMVWSKTPTSEQLASLNLKEGRNDVIFTFSTPMLGEQKVDARIFLWKWNARIVISDVDGTITKSDVLGQFMPLVGVDWSQTGVAHLFSAIKENGYELLFLSARAISQASLTRQFLINLKQDGKALPEGPVIISPDGLLPSLFREVIRRAPHEFKIACLEDIKALFPPDHNPFYAGFGNRDTDELSYLKVGIPKGKIFIINPKGEVAVQRRVDRKSYTSLHTLVHEMFPPPSSESSSVQEDFNSFNFWRLPPPEIVV